MCRTTHTLFQWEVISHFNTLLPLVVTAKSVNVYGPSKMFLPASTQVSNRLLLTTNKIIYYLNNMILHFFSKASYGVFYIQAQGNF